MVSFAFHFTLLLILALIVEAARPKNPSVTLLASPDPAEKLDAPFGPRHPDALILQGDRVEADPTEFERNFEVPEVFDPFALPPGPRAAQVGTAGAQPKDPLDWDLQPGFVAGGGLEGRGRKARAALAGGDGGNAQSERAVERGLRWLLAHQLENGSWHFDHRKSPCRGQCGNPGTETSTTAATALALLPFLGAGYTHLDGQYRDAVERGLYYLQKRTLTTPDGYDLQQGTMYAQGLATIAICEAYAMTSDPTLKDLGQGAIDFIVYAQNRRHGGWRYTPGEPGDTTVTGWQLMGLKSGQLAGYEIPQGTIYLVRRFLDTVEADSGAQYGYMTPDPRKTTTAIGLLMRMYIGWGRDNPALRRGVLYLDEWGPSQDKMYYNYYATQVMRHGEGPAWERWNARMRDHLIETQADGGHEAGSWHFANVHGDKGGRLYNTAMAVMTLEVYYRYMPLYRQKSVEQEF